MYNSNAVAEHSTQFLLTALSWLYHTNKFYQYSNIVQYSKGCTEKCLVIQGFLCIFHFLMHLYEILAWLADDISCKMHIMAAIAWNPISPNNSARDKDIIMNKVSIPRFLGSSCWLKSVSRYISLYEYANKGWPLQKILFPPY